MNATTASGIGAVSAICIITGQNTVSAMTIYGSKLMSKTGSYIKIDRGLKNNVIWLEKPFSKGQAWVDLLILTQGIDRDVLVRGKIQNQKRGNVYTSIVFLANRWGWSRNKVYRFLEDLTNAGMIVIQGWTGNGTLNGTRNGTQNGTVITIENWDVYQYSDAADGTQIRTVRSKKTEHTIKRQENDKEKEKERRGRSAPVSPPGRKSLPDRDDGTVADIPEKYRDQFKTYAEFWDWRYQ